MSLIVHPAPRIINDPIPNNVHSLTSGREPIGAANAVDHRHGCNSRNVPIGLSNRAKWAYGCSDFGM